MLNADFRARRQISKNFFAWRTHFQRAAQAKKSVATNNINFRALH
jgi:hypothetical protein